MERFSLYDTVAEHAQQERIELRDLGIRDHTPDGSRELVRFQARTSGMHQWCRITERLVIEGALRDARVWAGFQRLSRVGPVAVRYETLAQVVTSLAVYGVPDAQLRLSGAHIVNLAPSSALAREWFLVVRSSRHEAVIVAQDLDGFVQGKPSQRRFRAAASHHPVLVHAAAEALDAAAVPASI